MPKALIKKNANIIALPDDFARLIAVTKDGYFRYKVKYLVDATKAVRNRTFRVDIHVANAPFIREQQKTFVNFNSTVLLRQLRLRKSLQKDLIHSQRKRFILTLISDITKKIPNSQTVSLTKTQFTNRPVLSTKLRIRPALIADLQKQNLELPVFDINRNQLEESDTTFSSNALRVAATSLISVNHRDPAQLAGSRTHNLISAVRSIDGTLTKRALKAQTSIASSRVLVGSLINRRKITNHLQLANTNYVNILTKETSEFIEVEEIINIPVGDLEEDEFFFILQLKDRFNIIQQTLNKRVSHSRNVSQLEIPTIAPEVSALTVGPIGKTVLDIKQKDKNATGVNIYRRELNKSQPNVDATYDFVGSILIDDKDGIRRVEDIFASTNPIIYRVVPFNGSEILGAEFGSVVVQQRRNLVMRRGKYSQRPHFVSIAHEIQENSIIVSLKDFPPEPIALKLLRKNLSINESIATQIGEIKLIEADTNIPLIFEDTNVKTDRIYEYTVNFIYKDGTVETAANNLIIEYDPVSSNILQLNISEPEVVQAGDEFDVKFTIEKDVIKTETGLVKAFLEEQGLLTEFQGQVIDNREKLQDLFAVRVMRTNLTTGEIEDFGIIQSSQFSDRRFGRVKSVKPLQPGFNYRYSIIAHARDPETLFPTLEKKVFVRTNVSYTLRPFNFRHPITLLRGNIVTPSSLRRNYSKSTFTFGKVVDRKTADVSLADAQPSLYDGKVSRFGENSILVQWKVQGNANKIDHFIVILDVLGTRTVVGKSHNVTQNNSFQFVDELTNKECGELTYFIVPVFYDFSRGPELKTNQVLI